MQINSILMVCVGNICRSPSAEYIAKQRLANTNIQVSSAGLSAVVGSDIEPTAKNILISNNIPCDGHQARQINSDMLMQNDLILVMEREHLSAINNICPQASGKTFLIGKWQNDTAVPDPYCRDTQVFEQAFKLIEDGIDAWLQRLMLS